MGKATVNKEVLAIVEAHYEVLRSYLTQDDNGILEGLNKLEQSIVNLREVTKHPMKESQSDTE